MEFTYLEFPDERKELIKVNLKNINDQAIKELKAIAIIYFDQALNVETVNKIQSGYGIQIHGTRTNAGTKKVKISWEVKKESA